MKHIWPRLENRAPGFLKHEYTTIRGSSNLAWNWTFNIMKNSLKKSIKKIYENTFFELFSSTIQITRPFGKRNTIPNFDTFISQTVPALPFFKKGRIMKVFSILVLLAHTCFLVIFDAISLLFQIISQDLMFLKISSCVLLWLQSCGYQKYTRIVSKRGYFIEIPIHWFLWDTL